MERRGKRKGIRRRAEDSSKLKFYNECKSKVYNADLFPEPPIVANYRRYLGFNYSKPPDYLAAALIESGFGANKINIVIV